MRVALVLLAALAISAANIDDLHRAIRAGDAEMVRALLKQGVSVTAVDALVGTALHDAVWAGEKAIARLLIAGGADVNALHTEAGSTRLHYAIITDHVEIAEL